MSEITIMSKIKEFVTRIEFLFFPIDNNARAYPQVLQCLPPLEQPCSKWELN